MKLEIKRVTTEKKAFLGPKFTNQSTKTRRKKLKNI